MNPKVYKLILYLVAALFFSGQLLAQPTVIPVKPAPAVKQSAKNQDFGLELQLKGLDGQLAKLDVILKDFEVMIAPHVAGLERHIARAVENIDQHIVIVDGPNFRHPDPEDKNYIQAAEKVKNITRSFSVDLKDKLSINNQYGKVLINTWPKNEVKVEVEIKAYESSDSKAQELLEGVAISESRQGDLISFKTNFDRSSMNWWSRTKNGKEEKRGVQVNYTVYMPAKNPLDVTNKYGSTTLPDFDGPVNINSSYGSLTAMALSNAANRVKVSYGSATLEGFSSGILDVSYGSLKLAHADKLSADIRYSSAKIGRLTNGAKIDVAYGACRIDEMDRSVRDLIINSSYSGLTVGIDEGANFNFDVTVSYAGFNYNNGKVNITKKTPDENARGFNPTKNYIGTYGKGSDARVIIKSNYGGVKFL